MTAAIAYGIDLGTTNSSVSVAYDSGEVRLVPIDNQSAMPHSLPSIAYLHRNGNRAAGEEAVEEFLITGSLSTRCDRCPLVLPDIDGFYSECNQYRRSGACHDSRLISGLKSELANSEFIATHSWATDFEPEDLTAIILAELKARADREVGSSVDRVVLGYPVVFAGAEGPDYDHLQSMAESRLERSAERAGFTEVQLFPEPAAALLDQPLRDGFSLAADFGGGTYDVAVFHLVDGEAEIASLQGAAIGGEVFDGLVFDRAVADQIGVNQKLENGRSLPRWVTNRLRTLAGVKHLLSDPNLMPTLNQIRMEGGDIDAIDEILHGGHAFRFYREVEEAKIRLSSADSARISFRRPGIDVAVDVERSEFEAWIQPYVETIELTTRAALEEAQVEATDVHTVMRTGGSSQIPRFVGSLEAMFPLAEIRERPAFTSVAHGLGVYAGEVWGSG